MERELRLLDLVYRKQDPHHTEGKIVYAEDSENGDVQYVVLFRGEESYTSFSKSELSLCNNMIDSIFNTSSLQQHPLQQKELTQDEMQAIIDGSLDNPSSRRVLWYDILFYKRQWLRCSNDEIKPAVLQLFRYPIPEEIRCFLWSEFLGVQESYEVGYYSIIRSKQFGIPSSSLSVIEADLRRMDISPPEYRQMLRLLTSIYLHDSKTGYVQGMHFLMYSLLHLFTEEEAFFVFLRIIDFLPPNYYDFNLEGINTDLLVVAALLNKVDAFLYATMEQKTGDMIFFLSPVYKWLVDLFSNPFDASFTFHLLDFVFCAGNGALVLAAVSLITQFRKQFVTCTTMEEVTRVFASISDVTKGEAVCRSVEYVYEACLMGNQREIQLLRNELHHETQRANSGCEETPAIEEQNGVVGDLVKGETQSAPPSSNFFLSMQMSMHMHQIRSSFKRVSGFGSAAGEDPQQARRHLRSSMDIIAAEHFPSFTDFTESGEEEADVNPWRESVVEEEVVKDLRKSWAEKAEEKEEPSEEAEEVEGKRERKEMQSMKKWLQSDVLLKRVLLLYDDVRNRRTFNITNEVEECVGDGNFLQGNTIDCDENYLSSYRSHLCV